MTGWTAPRRTAEAAKVYAAAEADRTARPDRYRLDKETIVGRATRQPDDPSRFATGWREGLDQYLGSAQEDGRLNAVGVRMVAGAATARLGAGVTMARYLDAHPDVVDRPLAPPIVIIGGWRTGTTFLFRLLASDPRLRAPLPAELAAPCRVAGLSGAEREAFIEGGRAAHDHLHLLNPQLRAIHDSGAWLPEECVLALGADLRNWGFTSTVRLNSYAAWLAGQSMASGYRQYRTVLQALDGDDGRRWVLKAPAHTAELPHLVAAFPNAIVVHLHRDIVETISSGASLFAVFRSTYSDHVDPADVGRFQADQTELWLRRAAAFRSEPGSAAATFLDLDYAELVGSPVTAVRRVYEVAGIEPPADLERFVTDHQAAHPRHRHGPHAYTAADFGLDDGELRERFSFLDR